MRAGVGPQHVAGVAVAVQAQISYIARTLVTAADAVERLLRHAAVDIHQIERNEILREQIIARLLPEVCDIERWALIERLQRADGVNPTDEAPDPLERFAVFEIRCPTSAPLEYGEAESFVFMQRGAGHERHRRHHGNLGFGENLRKDMLFQNRRIRPALRPVELGNQRRAVVHANLINAILVAVQGEQTTVAAQADCIKRIENQVRRQRGKGKTGLCCHKRHCRCTASCTASAIK